MKLSLIVAMSENHVIGNKNALPWKLSEDLKRFKAITLNHPVVMGRKTFESIGKILPQRENIIISRNSQLVIHGAKIFSEFNQFIEAYRSFQDEIFIIGGAQIYAQSLPFINKIYLTLIHENIEGDAFFPQIDWELFEITLREKREDPLSFEFIEMIRK